MPTLSTHLSVLVSSDAFHTPVVCIVHLTHFSAHPRSDPNRVVRSLTRARRKGSFFTYSFPPRLSRSCISTVFCVSFSFHPIRMYPDLALFSYLGLSFWYDFLAV
jgi:hypothetical protein